MNIVTYNPELGPDLAQGDLLLTFLGHPEFEKRWGGKAPQGTEIRRGEGRIRLLEGEVTGHHMSPEAIAEAKYIRAGARIHLVASLAMIAIAVVAHLMGGI